MANVSRTQIVDAVEDLKQVGNWPKSINEAELRTILLPMVRAAIPQVQTVCLAVANLTITTEDVVLVNCTTSNGTGVTVTLPAAPVAGQVVQVKRLDANGGTDNVTVTNGADFSQTVNTQYDRVAFTYSGTAWSAAAPVADGSAPLVLDTDAGVIIADNDGAIDLTLTLPPAAQSLGRQITVKAMDAGNSVIVGGNASETVDGAANADLTTDLDYVTVVCDGAAWHITSSKVGA